MGKARTCGSVGHPALYLTAIYCHHESRWVVWVNGGTADTPGPTVEVALGPFDDNEDLVELVAHWTTDLTRRAADARDGETPTCVGVFRCLGQDVCDSTSPL